MIAGTTRADWVVTMNSTNLDSIPTISIEQLDHVTGGANGAILGGIGQAASGVGGMLGGVGGLLGGIGQLKVAKAQAEQIRAQTAQLRAGGGAPAGGQAQ